MCQDWIVSSVIGKTQEAKAIMSTFWYNGTRDPMGPHIVPGN